MNQHFKQNIYNFLLNLIEERIEIAQSNIKNTTESRDGESKSSAGDKYETGRSMMQIEQQQNEQQLSKAIQLKLQLQQINLEKVYQTAAFGSLVYTNFGNYFIAIGLGEIKIKNEMVFVVSASSPIGLQLLNKKKDETFQFFNKEFQIIGVQ